MVVKHTAEGIEGVLEVDYSKYFDKSWFEFEDFRYLLNSSYMSNLNYYVAESYAGGHVYPRIPAYMYKAFKLTAITNIRVVIFADEPFTNVYANGLAFGQMNNPSHLRPKDALNIAKAVEKLHFDKTNVSFDPTLEDWARQGVLLLNTSLISELACPNKHRKAFKNFTRQIVKIVNDELADVIFVFTNKEQEKLFGKYVNKTYNHTIQVDGITENTDLFDEVNKILDYSERADEPIMWL